MLLFSGRENYVTLISHRTVKTNDASAAAAAVDPPCLDNRDEGAMKGMWPYSYCPNSRHLHPMYHYHYRRRKNGDGDAMKITATMNSQAYHSPYLDDGNMDYAAAVEDHIVVVVPLSWTDVVVDTCNIPVVLQVVPAAVAVERDAVVVGMIH